ncbi:MAG: nitroreductase family protein [Bacillota bacterium]
MEKINWENAINIRRSTRSFEMIPVESSTMDKLQSFIPKLQVPFKHDASIRFFKASPDKKLYTVFTAPPDGAAFLSRTDPCSISKTGFAGEIFVLYATSLGLATCWYGHYTLAELERIMPHLGKYALQPNPKWGYGKETVEGERTICITPLGYWQKKGVRVFDRMQESLISYRRKPVEAFLEGDSSADKLPPEILYGFDLARKAPSGANSQHWRFKVSADCKKIFIAMPVGYKHIKWEHPDVDIGICACHFWLGLTLKGVNCDVSVREEEGRAVWYFEL